MRAVLAAFSLTLALLLSACGDGSGSASASSSAAPTPTTSASGNVVKGVIRNGVIKVMRWTGSGYAEVTSARTGSTGEFTLSIPNPVPGELLRLDLGLSADTSAGKRTEMLCDAAQCGTASFGEWAPLVVDPGLSSWVSVNADGTVTLMPVTPVSTLVVRYAEDVGGGHLDAVALQVALQRVADVFRMTPEQLMARPGNIVDVVWLEAASPDALKVSLLAAAFADLSRTSGLGLDDVINNYVTSFVLNNGHLVQDGSGTTIGSVYRGISNVIAVAGSPEVQAEVSTWITSALSGLQVDQLSTAACAPDCPPFDSDNFLNALGIGENTLGGDIRRVMAEKNVLTLEELLAGELAKYGWLGSPDSIGVLGLALQIGIGSLGASMGMPAMEPEGITVTRTGDTLHFEGVQNTLYVNVDVTLAPVLEAIQSHTGSAPGPVFTFAAKGSVANDQVRGTIDGSFSIDATGTDFQPLRNAYAAMIMAQIYDDEPGMLAAQKALSTAMAGIISTGAATFTLDGSVGLAALAAAGDSLVETSRLAVEGRAWLKVNMASAANGGDVALEGEVEHGKLTLPSGDWFEVDPDKGHFLNFLVKQSGTASAKFGAFALGHAATVSGDGSLAGLGALLVDLRDSLAQSMKEEGEINLTAAITALMEDASALRLAVAGKATIPDFGHSYTLTIAEGHLKLTQPNSTDVALDVSIGNQGLLARAGGQWWLVGLKLDPLAGPSLTLADSSGGEWLLSFGLGTMTASL